MIKSQIPNPKSQTNPKSQIPNSNVVSKLKEILQGKILILGIGNVLKQDDGFGSLLAKRLIGKLKNFNVFDLEDTPENLLGKILNKKSDTILIIDSVSFSSKPGSFKLFSPGEIKDKNIFFTHNSSLGLIARFIKENSNANVFLLGVQPASVGFGEGLSYKLTHALQDLELVLLELDRQKCATQSQVK